jgi:ubiquinone/menaquinone biosynthesis C-methylase UbiE
MDERQIETINYYNKEANTWAMSHGGNEKHSWWEDEMIKFNEYLPSGKVIEIGIGTGKDAEALINLGYEYTGIDASVGLLELAAKRNPSATFIHKYVQEIDPSLGEFDGFWASAILLHIPKDEIRDSLLAISSVIKNKGIGFITLKEGYGENVDEKTGRLYSYYTEDEFNDILNSAGFSILEVGRRYGEENNWLIFYVQKVE